MTFTMNVNCIEMKGTLESANPQHSQLQTFYDHNYMHSAFMLLAC